MKLNGGDGFSTSVHATTIGALGTLSVNIIVRMSSLHVKQYPSYTPQIMVMTGFMTIAAIARITVDFSGYKEMLLVLAASAWSIAFLIALFILLKNNTVQRVNIARNATNPVRSRKDKIIRKANFL